MEVGGRSGQERMKKRNGPAQVTSFAFYTSTPRFLHLTDLP